MNGETDNSGSSSLHKNNSTTSINEGDNVRSSDDGDSFDWTALAVLQAVAVFVASGFAEIGGGWLVWKAVRDGKPWWWAVVGSLILIIYGFLPTLQPTDSFGRIYAVYGGFFIILSFLFGWLMDGDKPDRGDLIGGTIALAGVLVVMFWPR
jgi:drug/metabolite transporter superfamily protein YnfA